MTSDPLIRAHIRLVGRVQGVGFRYAIAREADTAGVKGWVRNLDSGGVEAVFEGSKTVVEDVVRWCGDGPPGASVRDIDVHWDEPPEQFTDFAIRPTARS